VRLVELRLPNDADLLQARRQDLAKRVADGLFTPLLDEAGPRMNQVTAIVPSSGWIGGQHLAPNTTRSDQSLVGPVARFVPAVVAIAVLAIAGCGGGGTKTVTQIRTQTSAEPLTKAEYIARADAVCKAQEAKRAELEQQVAELTPITSGETGEVAALLRQQADNQMAEVKGLLALRPPGADAANLSSLLSILSAEITDLDDWADAYDRRNVREIRSLQIRVAEHGAKASALAGEYGFKVCGGPGNTGNLTRFR
jgi:hypothetical protein